jgi:hypothetical protein
VVCSRSRAGARLARQMSRPPGGHVDQMKANVVSSLQFAMAGAVHTRLPGHADFHNELCSKRITEYTCMSGIRDRGLPGMIRPVPMAT